MTCDNPAGSSDSVLFAAIGRRLAEDWDVFDGNDGVPYLGLDYYAMALTVEEAAACRRVAARNGRKPDT